MTTEEKSKLLILQARMLEENDHKLKERDCKIDELLTQLATLNSALSESNRTASAMASSLNEIINDQKSLIKKLTADNEKLIQLLSVSNKNAYGSKSQKRN